MAITINFEYAKYVCIIYIYLHVYVCIYNYIYTFIVFTIHGVYIRLCMSIYYIYIYVQHYETQDPICKPCRLPTYSPHVTYSKQLSNSSEII